MKNFEGIIMVWVLTLKYGHRVEGGNLWYWRRYLILIFTKQIEL